MDRLSSQIARGASGTLVVRLASSAMLLLLAIAIGNFLGIAAFGRYSYTIVLANLIATPIAMGLDTLTTREIAATAARDELGALRGILRFATLVIVGLGAISLLVGLVMPSATLRHAAWLAPLIAALRVQGGVLRGFRAVAWSRAPEQIVVPATVLIAVLVAELVGSALTSGHTVLFHFFGVGLALLVNQLHIARQELPGKENVPQLHSRTWTSAALPMLLTGGARQLNSRLDILMVGAFLTDQDIGMYTIAVRGAEFVVMPLSAANGALAPQFARLSALADLEAFGAVARRWARIAAGLALPITLILALFAGTFFDVLGSPSPPGALLAFRILLIARLVLVAGGPAGTALAMTGNERRAAIVLGGSVAINAGLNAVLLPWLELPGAAIAFAVSVVFVIVVSNLFLRRQLGFSVHVLAAASQASGAPAVAPLTRTGGSS